MKRIAVLFTATLIAVFANAEVSLSPLFSDNMVLQQNGRPLLWGRAAPGTIVKISTSWNGKSYNVTADGNGDFKVRLSTSKFGGPYQIRVTQGNTISLNNVLLGDVWLCSGQSNMEMPLARWGKIKDYEKEIANASYPKIRLLQMRQTMSAYPSESIIVNNDRWDICSPETIGDFSATAYFFAKELYEKTKTPIGLIHSSWGGTVAEAWVSYDFLAPFDDIYTVAGRVKNNEEDVNYKKELQQLIDWEEGIKALDKGYANAQPVWVTANIDNDGWKDMSLSASWENEGLPGFDGIVWFRKTITIPEELKGQDLYLNFMADDDDIAWFNGKQIGNSYGWIEMRKYKIPKELIKPGNNEIVIRIFDTGGGGGLYSDIFNISNNSGNSLSLKGNWKYKIGYTLKEQRRRPEPPNGPNRPTVLFNGMIYPFINYAIKGVIWYQGESNVGQSEIYQRLFPSLINCWRSYFKKEDMPFYFVQLANFLKADTVPVNSDWALLREAQAHTLKLNNTGMAVAIDIGEADDIHPKNKQEVGRRLALNALAKDYKMPVAYSGPLYDSYKIEGDKIRISFSHADAMRSSDGRALRGFAIAGADKKFYWADAVISNKEIIVSCKEVRYPLAVRYGWANNPAVNLCNAAALPAVPFRTDNW